MPLLSLFLGCLACAASGRRVWSSTRQSQRSSIVEADSAFQQAQAFATLLLASNPSVAFNPSCLGSQCSVILDRWSRQALVHTAQPLSPRPEMSSPQDSYSDKSDLVTQLEEKIAQKPAALVIREGCPDCEEVEKIFDEVGAQPEMIVLDALDDEMRAEAEEHLEKLTGVSKTPYVFLEYKYWGGVDKVRQFAENKTMEVALLNAWQLFRDDMNDKRDVSLLKKTNKQWKKELKKSVYNSLRGRTDEFPFSHRFAELMPKEGYFACVACDLPLFSAESKYRPTVEAQDGWPAFDMCLHSEEIGCHLYTRPDGISVEGLELVCQKCGGHIGHVYYDDDRPINPNGERNSANGIALKYHEEDLPDDVWERKVTLVKS